MAYFNPSASAGAGSVAARAVINPMNLPYAAVGDGVTDDGAKILAAIQAGVNSNTPVYIPPRTFAANNMTASTPGTVIMYGEPGLSIIKRTAAVGSTFLQFTQSSVTLSGLTFDMNSAEVTANQWGVRFQTGNQNVTIDDCVFKNNSGTLGGGLAIFNVNSTVNTSGRTIIRNSEITGNTWNALYLGSLNNVTLENNFIHDNTGTATGLRIGSYLTASVSNYITNVIATGNTIVRNWVGVQIGGFSPTNGYYDFTVPPAKYVRLEGNHIEDNHANVIMQGHYIDVVDNDIIQTADYSGMDALIYCNGMYSNILSNRITGIDATWGVDTGGSTKVGVLDNTITMGAGNALNPGGTADCTVKRNKVSVSGNAFCCTILNTESGGGGEFPTLCSNLIIDDNEFEMSGSGSRGLLLTNNAGGQGLPTQITNNRFKTLNGASSFYAMDVRAAGNAVYIKGNTMNGLRRQFNNPTGGNDVVYEQWADEVATFSSASATIRSILSGFQSTYGAGSSILFVKPSNGGSGYTAATMLSASGGGSGFAADPIIINGVIIAVDVTSFGTGYTSPTITATDAGGGTGATFTVTQFPAQLSGREITISSTSVNETILSGGGYIGLSPAEALYLLANGPSYKLRTFGTAGWSVIAEMGWPRVAVGNLPTPSSSLNGARARVTGSTTKMYDTRCDGSDWIWPDGTTVTT